MFLFAICDLRFGNLRSEICNLCVVRPSLLDCAVRYRRLAMKDLNSQQQEAVQVTEGTLLVLAGAGSGKTRVITSRIAHLIEQAAVPPWQILAVTFTNKAAGEMKSRVEAALDPGLRTSSPLISTFHSLCVRILR